MAEKSRSEAMNLRGARGPLRYLLLSLLLIMVISCQNGAKVSERSPSSLSGGDSCFDLMLPLADEYQSLRKGEWEVSELARKDLLDEEQWQAMREDEAWQKFISRDNQSDEEKEMGFVVLSLLRKRFPNVDEKRLKDRYRVLMAFCGR